MSKSILEVRGIGSSTAAVLAESGIVTPEDLAAQKVSQIAAIKGFSETRAGQVIAGAQALISSSETKSTKTTKPAQGPADKKKVAKKKEKEKTKKTKKAAKAANKTKKVAKNKKNKNSAKKTKK